MRFDGLAFADLNVINEVELADSKTEKTLSRARDDGPVNVAKLFAYFAKHRAVAFDRIS